MASAKELLTEFLAKAIGELDQELWLKKQLLPVLRKKKALDKKIAQALGVKATPEIKPGSKIKDKAKETKALTTPIVSTNKICVRCQRPTPIGSVRCIQCGKNPDKR